MAGERRVRLGGVQLGVRVDPRAVRRIRDSLPYRLVRPALRALRGAQAPPATAKGREPVLPIYEPATRHPRIDVDALPTEAARDLAARANDIDWYHVIELPGGVVTPGRADHRHELQHYGLPEDMSGMRVLDVATFDGYWAFEFERRGAEVVAVDVAKFSDVDLPLRVAEHLSPGIDQRMGAGFRLAHEALGSHVERREISVYDLTPENVGTFDLVFMSDLLQHLRDPQRALERVYSLVRKDGYLLLAEEYDPALETPDDAPLVELRRYVRYVWTIPSVAALRVMLNVAGFNRITEVSRPMLKYLGEYGAHKVVFRAHPWAPPSSNGTRPEPEG